MVNHSNNQSLSTIYGHNMGDQNYESLNMAILLLSIYHIWLHMPYMAIIWSFYNRLKTNF